MTDGQIHAKRKTTHTHANTLIVWILDNSVKLKQHSIERVNDRWLVSNALVLPLGRSFRINVALLPSEC